MRYVDLPAETAATNRDTSTVRCIAAGMLREEKAGRHIDGIQTHTHTHTHTHMRYILDSRMC